MRFLEIVTNIASVGIGIVLLWGWIALFSELIARRTGEKPTVPYPDDALWAGLQRVGRVNRHLASSRSRQRHSARRPQRPVRPRPTGQSASGS
jgi:hypothetical protein